MGKDGQIEVARWGNGWTLSRLVDEEASKGLGLFANPVTRPLFIVCDPLGDIAYQLVYNDLQQRFSNDYLNIQLYDVAAPFPSAVARQVCISAIAEVLDLPITNSYLPKGPAVIPMFLEDAQHALDEESSKLPSLIERLAKIYPTEMAKGKPQREALGEARKNYANASLQNLQWTLNLNRFRSPSMREYASYPSKADVRREVLKGVGIIRGTSYQLVLRLDFLPEPSWSVSVEQEYYTDDEPRTPEVLASHAIGPVHALVQAGVLAPLTQEGRTTLEAVKASAEEWLDGYLMDAPELTECFDLESYRLLGTLTPLLWKLPDFVAWAKEQPHVR